MNYLINSTLHKTTFIQSRKQQKNLKIILVQSKERFLIYKKFLKSSLKIRQNPTNFVVLFTINTENILKSQKNVRYLRKFETKKIDSRYIYTLFY